MYAKKASLAAMSLALCLAVSTPLAVLAQGEDAAPAPEKKSPHEKIWWNQPDKIQVLTLTAEQRQKMDTFLTGFFKQAPRPNDRQKNMSVFTSALAKGDWEAADKAVEAMAAAAAKPIHVTTGLMIDVLQVLSPVQLRTFTARYPELLRRPWVRLRGMARSPGARGSQGGNSR